MTNKDIFTVTITGADGEVREFASDCVIVIAHNTHEDVEQELGFNMSLNISAQNSTTLMLLEAMDQAKQQILDSDPELEKAYNIMLVYKTTHTTED